MNTLTLPKTIELQIMNIIQIVLLEFYPSWLALPREIRRKYAKSLEEIIAKYPDVKVRFCDSEAFPGSNFTDFLICETENLKSYHFMWEEIRDTEPYTRGYFKIKDVIMGAENAFQSYEKESLKI